MFTRKAGRHAPALILGLVLILSLGRSAAAQDAEWTLMIYLDSDNNLELAGIEDFLEIASIGSTDDVQVVVLMDRIAGEDNSYGDWRDTRRGLVRPGDTPSASWGESIGEANMGDPDTLVDFVEWGMANYPAARYGLVLWDHGNGWWPAAERSLPRVKGVCWDDTDGSDGLSVKEIREALNEIATSSAPVDLIGFDACLMAMVEVAYELRQSGAIMVASEDLEPGRGWPYDAILETLTDQPSITAEALGVLIVDAYDDSVHDLSWDYPLTLSAVDLSEMSTVASEIDALAEALREGYASPTSSCVAAANDVMTAINAAVISEKHWPDATGPNGLAIFFPETSDDFSASYRDSVLLFAGATQWDEFLQDFYSSMSSSWVAQIRAATQECDEGYPSHVDLYDFCRGLVGELDTDSDGDGISDSSDNCAQVANADQTDTDGDGDGDACDPDDDDDGVADASDGCPTDANKTDPGTCGCGTADTDGDADGTADCIDECPNDPGQTLAGACGCGVADTDSDSDGTADCLDGCPNDPDKTSAGTCGCGVADADSDADGIVDCLEAPGPNPDEQVAGFQETPPSVACAAGTAGAMVPMALGLWCLRPSRRRW